jgi:lysozyme
MDRTLILALCLGLAACGSRAPEPARDRQVVSVTSSNFTDADPIDWQGRAPESYPVHGIDLSRYQTAVDWPTARANGVNFAFVKATEGGDQVDPMFKVHWRGAGAAGVRRGAYHFFYHCRPAAEQARWYIRHVPRTKGALPPVLDMEWTPTSPTCTIRRDGETIRAEARVFIAAVTAHYGQRPILYTSVDFFEDNEMWRVAGAEFWLRSVAAHPRDVYDGQHWSFWQYTSTGKVPGIAGRVDINVFAGSQAAWGDWLAARVQ